MTKKNRSAGSAAGVDSPVSRVRYRVLIWLVIGGIINYVDRANLSIAAPSMIHQLGLTATEIGLMGTVFSWCYAVGQLPAGWLSDRIGARRIYALALVVWSLGTLGMGLSSVLAIFLIWRVVLGFGEAPCWPTAAKITALWFPRSERGIATGIFDSASKWGPAIAPPILVGLLALTGWRGLFYITGVVGLLFALVFYVVYRDPAAHRSLPEREFEFIKAEGGAVQSAPPAAAEWFALFGQRTIWGMIGGYFCTIWIWNIFLVFLPLYLSDTYNVSLAELGLTASIPWVGGAIGNIAAGFVARELSERVGLAVITARKTVIGVSALAAGVSLVLLPWASSLTLTVVDMTIALAFVSAITGSAWALAGDVAPASMVASVGSIQNFGGYFGGAFSPLLAGMIVDATGSWTLAFTSAAVLAVGAAVCYTFIVGPPVAKADERPVAV